MDLRPHHVASFLTALSLLPVFWIFVVQGVTTTTEIDLVTGDTSSSSDFGAQFGKAIIFFILAAAFAAAGWFLKEKDTQWPPGIRELLAKMNLAPVQPPGPRPPYGAPPPYSPTPNYPRPQIPYGSPPPPGPVPPPSSPPPPYPQSPPR